MAGQEINSRPLIPVPELGHHTTPRWSLLLSQALIVSKQHILRFISFI